MLIIYCYCFIPCKFFVSAVLSHAFSLEPDSLVGFYGISTILGYLMPNPLYIHLLNIICKHIMLIAFFK